MHVSNNGAEYGFGMHLHFVRHLVHPFFPTKSCRRLGAAVENVRCSKAAKALQAKADSTLRSSWAILHPSTDWAPRRLTSVVRRDSAHSMRYGRQREELSPMISRSRFRGETYANEKRKAKQKLIAKRASIRPRSGARKASRSRIRISRSGESCVESSGQVCAQAGSIRCAKRPACPQQPMYLETTWLQWQFCLDRWWDSRQASQGAFTAAQFGIRTRSRVHVFGLLLVSGGQRRWKISPMSWPRCGRRNNKIPPPRLEPGSLR